MKKLITFIAIGLLSACGNIPDSPPPPDKPPVETPCPECSECPNCPEEEPCPGCPPAEPCPAPPECPNCPPPPEPPPVLDDVEHKFTEFESSAVLGAKDTLGLYVADPRDELRAAVFAMSELHQKWDAVLGIDVGEGNLVEIGSSTGKADQKVDLNIVTLCEGRYKDVCTAVVITNGNEVKALKLTITDSQRVFTWDKK